MSSSLHQIRCYYRRMCCSQNVNMSMLGGCSQRFPKMFMNSLDMLCGSCQLRQQCMSALPVTCISCYAGKPTDMIINEYSDEYGFSAKATNSKWVLQKPSLINPPLAAAG